MSTTDTNTDNNYSFFQLADELHARRERLRPLWVMKPEERLARFHRGEMTQEEMYAWAARCPREVPKLQGEFLFIAASTPEACVTCPTCGDDEVHLEADGKLAKHPDHRHAFDPLNPSALRPVCPASASS